jgi:hypothetical protein
LAKCRDPCWRKAGATADSGGPGFRRLRAPAAGLETRRGVLGRQGPEPVRARSVHRDSRRCRARGTSSLLGRQPPHAPAQREPGDSGVTDRAADHREAVGVVAASTSAQAAPPPTYARRASGSTRTPESRDRSILTAPPAMVPPAALCPRTTLRVPAPSVLRRRALPRANRSRS